MVSELPEEDGLFADKLIVELLDVDNFVDELDVEFPEVEDFGADELVGWFPELEGFAADELAT